MIKTETLQQAIQFVLGTPEAKKYIDEMESSPDTFAIAQISASVIHYNKSIIRVFINFHEKGNPNNFKEDALIDVQGTHFGDFKVLNVVAYQSNPLI